MILVLDLLARVSSMLPHPGLEVDNSLDDFCMFGMVRGSAMLPQIRSDVIHSPDDLCVICMTEITPAPPLDP